MLKRIFGALIAGLIVGGGSVFFVWRWQQGLKPIPVEVSSSVANLITNPVTSTPETESNPSATPTTDPEPTPIESEPEMEPSSSISIPAKYLIEGVPFVSQAPTRNWDMPFQEACEEASVLMVNRFYTKKPLPSVEEQDQIIVDMTEWGVEAMDGHVDTDAKTSARYFTEYLEYDPARVSVVYDMTINDIKAVLASGRPVIVPAAGRELGNENFVEPGPLYHMLVIVGYDQDEFITNDPGTRKGEGFRYKQQTLFAAIHDLPDAKERILEGRKAMIVVSP